jgi:hypothetical protein
MVFKFITEDGLKKLKTEKNEFTVENHSLIEKIVLNGFKYLILRILE